VPVVTQSQRVKKQKKQQTRVSAKVTGKYSILKDPDSIRYDVG